MATSTLSGQMASRERGKATCVHHRRSKLDHYCEKCQDLVCIKCVSTVHKGHTFCSLADVSSLKRKEIQTFVDKAEKVYLVNIDKYMTTTDKHLRDNASIFGRLSNEVTTQTNILKQDLDLLAAKTLSLYQQMEEENNKLLQDYKRKLDMYARKLKELVDECKDALQEGSDIQVYDVGCEIQAPSSLPAEPILRKANFDPNRSPYTHLERALGIVSTSTESPIKDLQSPDHSVESSSSEQGLVSSLQQLKLKATSAVIKQKVGPKRGISSTQIEPVTRPSNLILSPTKVLREWESQCVMTSVCPTTDGQAWTSYSISGTLTLLNKKGKVVREIKQNIWITDISLSPTTGSVWACDLEHNIMELVSEDLVRRFRSPKKPLCICITAENKVIVGMDKHISKFTSKGELVLTTLVAEAGKPYVRSPHRIAECPITHNIAVTDRDSKRDGGNGKPRVVVMDTDFNKLIRYDEGIPKLHQPTPQSGGKYQFDPFAVVYDSVGNLLIGDHDNNCVFLISGSGEFLRLIHFSKHSTFAIGTGRKDILWTVYEGKNVKLLQYSSL